MRYLRNGLTVAIVTFLFIYWAARVPLWNAHLQVDVWISWLRVSYYFDHGRTFAGMVGNEILPATLLYILAPVGMIPVGWLSYQTYLPATLVLNMIPLVLTWYLARERRMLLSFLILLGPILLFRFDGIVALLLISSFLTFINGRYGLSGALMGGAVGMKVFPILFVPYLLLLLLIRRSYKAIFHFLITFSIAMIVPIVAFLWMGGSLEQIQSALMFHSQKLISIESIPGGLITAYGLATNGYPPPLIPGNGIWSVPGPHELLNKIWMLPIFFLYIYIYTKKSIFLMKFDWRVPLSLMLTFLVFSKNLNPQYVWWFMVLLPFVAVNKWVWFFSLVVALTNQLVYPIFYTTFIEDFYRANQAYWIYFVLLARNLSVVGIFIICLCQILFLDRKQK